MPQHLKIVLVFISPWLARATVAKGAELSTAWCLEAPTRNDVCQCDGWQGSKLFQVVSTFWAALRAVNGSVAAMSFWLDTLFGSDFKEMLFLAESFDKEIATLRWPCGRVQPGCSASKLCRVSASARWAANLFGEDLLAALQRYGECAPMWSHIAVMISFKFSLVAQRLWSTGRAAWERKSKSTRRWGSEVSDLGVALHVSHKFFDLGLHAGLLCGAAGPMPGAPMSLGELFLNARIWERTWRQKEPQWHDQWLSARSSDPVCPPEETTAARPPNSAGSDAGLVVSCFIPAVYPTEMPLLEEIADTFGARCDRCAFFVAKPVFAAGGGEFFEAPDSIGACAVVNLREHFASLAVDDWQVPNVLQKVTHIILYAEAHMVADWVCLVETDVYFSPANFKRLVRARGLRAQDLHWIGYTHMHSVLEEGMMVEPATGSCLSRAAVLAAAKRFRQERPADGGPRLQWPPTLFACVPFMPGVHTDFTPIFNVCMQEAGIWPPAPELIHDSRGRLFFSNFIPWNENISSMRPPSRPCFHPLGEESCQRAYSDLSADYVLWKGRELWYSPCRDSNPESWVAEYPVSLHGHVTHDQRYRPSQLWKRRNPSLRQVHQRLVQDNFRFRP